MSKGSVAHRSTNANVRTTAITKEIPGVPAACGLISLGMKNDEAESSIRPLNSASMRFLRQGKLLSRRRLARVLVRASMLGQLGGESSAEPHIEPDRFGGPPNALK